MRFADPVVSDHRELKLLTICHSTAMPGGEMAKALKVSRSNLSKLMKPLVEAGLVTKAGSTKSASYQLPPAKSK
jgi:DNA-binding MarR family transcriptional regulator